MTQPFTILWNAGLLVLCSLSTHPVLLWLAIQLTLAPRFIVPGRATPSSTSTSGAPHSRHVLRRLTSLEWTGSGLFTIGLLLLVWFSREGEAASEAAEMGTGIALLLLVCGLGGLLGWFPFPRVACAGEDDSQVAATFGQSLLPVLVAVVFLYQIVDGVGLTAQQMMLLAVPGMFSLLIASSRLMWENRLALRLRLSAMTLMSLGVLAVCLIALDGGSSVDSDPESLTNVPGGRTILMTLLCAETAAWLTLLFGGLLLSSDTGVDYDEILGGALLRRPVPAAIMLLGLFSLAGIPPLPGFWWRFNLLVAWMLPSHPSVLTGVVEPNRAATTLACLFLLLWIVTALGHLRLVRTLILVAPFRVRTEPRPLRLWLGAAFSLLLLTASFLIPLR